MKLRYVKVEESTDFAETTVPLERLTSLLGVNGTGKSKFLQMLKGALQPSIRNPIGTVALTSNYFFPRSPITIFFEIDGDSVPGDQPNRWRPTSSDLKLIEDLIQNSTRSGRNPSPAEFAFASNDDRNDAREGAEPFPFPRIDVRNASSVPHCEHYGSVLHDFLTSGADERIVKLIEGLARNLLLAVSSVEETKWAVFGRMPIRDAKEALSTLWPDFVNLFENPVVESKVNGLTPLFVKSSYRAFARDAQINLDPEWPNHLIDLPECYVEHDQIVMPLFGFGFNDELRGGGNDHYIDPLRRCLPRVVHLSGERHGFSERLDVGIELIAKRFENESDRDEPPTVPPRWDESTRLEGYKVQSGEYRIKSRALLFNGYPSNRDPNGVLERPFSWLRSKNSESVGQFDVIASHATEFVVADSILDSIALTQQRIAELAPGFIGEQFDVHLELLDPTAWDTHGRRVMMSLQPKYRPHDLNGQIAIDPELAGRGIATWVTTVAEIAIHDLLWAGIGGAEDSPEFGTALNNVLVLLDEPEAYLHPGAIYSSIKWIQDLTAYGAQVIVATHNYQVFDIEWVSRSRLMFSRENVRVEKSLMPRTHIRDLESNGQHLTRFAAQVGMTSGDLLLRTKTLLFVEGIVDVEFISLLYPELLGRLGVRLVPLDGDINASSILAQGIPVAKLLSSNIRIFLDSITSKNAPKNIDGDFFDRLSSGEYERELQRVDTQFVAIPRNVVPTFALGRHGKADIWYYVPDEILTEVIRAEQERHPSWRLKEFNLSSVVEEFKDKSVSSLKRYVKDEFGFNLDREHAGQVAKLMRIRGLRFEKSFLDSLEFLLSDFAPPVSS